MNMGEQRNPAKRFSFIFDSMKNTELNGTIDLHKEAENDPEKHYKRINRIAAGSGTTPKEVEALFAHHKKFSVMMGKLGKKGMLKAAQPGQQEAMMASAQARQEAAQAKQGAAMMSQMPPGAAEYMKNMQAGGAGGAGPNMGDMMEMMKKMKGMGMGM
jgi:signal recognition particle GTPase